MDRLRAGEVKRHVAREGIDRDRGVRWRARLEYRRDRARQAATAHALSASAREEKMGCCPSSRAQVYASEATGAEEIARLTADDSTPSSRGVQAWGAPPETPPQQASPPRRDSRRPDTEPTEEMLAAPGAEFEPEPEPQPQLEPELAPSGAGAMDEAAAGANPQSLETEAMGSPMEVECLSCFPKRSKSPVRWCAFRHTRHGAHNVWKKGA